MIHPGLKSQVDALSRLEMARIWRFAASGHPLLSGEAGSYFKQRFSELGGFSPAISKALG